MSPCTFIRMHNETLSVAAMRVCNQNVRPLESIAETQPQLQPALLRLWVLNREL